jgi:CubicO group peptidase (beta-lactamase class C family)
MMHASRIAIALLASAAFGPAAGAQSQATPAVSQPPPAATSPMPLDAAASDPTLLGWMVGTPPPPGKTIRHADASFFKFPQTRWSFSNWRRLFPTAGVSRGDGPVAELPRTPDVAPLDGVTFTPMKSNVTMTFAEALAALYTDGVVVLHDGRIVYERYFGALDATRPHICFSVTKSFFGTLGAMLVAEGKLDEGAPVSRYLPELAGSGFGNATVRQVLDMTTSLDYAEDYAAPGASSFIAYARAAGLLPTPPGATGPGNVYDFARSLMQAGPHGQRFQYASPNTDVVGWLVARVSGQRPEVVLQERLWRRLGAEDDGYMALDPWGNATAAGGFNVRLRDLARFGEMLRLDGRFNGQQIVPAEVVARIRKGADRDAFAAAGYETLAGWSYRDQWWIAHDAHGTFMARGIHGQTIWVDPQARVVIARFGSHPVASTVNFDPVALPAYRAVADHLMGAGRRH